MKRIKCYVVSFSVNVGDIAHVCHEYYEHEKNAIKRVAMLDRLPVINYVYAYPKFNDQYFEMNDKEIERAS